MRQDWKKKLQKYASAVRVVVLGYVIFAGCFLFPIQSERFPLDGSKLYLLVGSYGMIGLALAGIYGPGKGWKIWLMLFGFTALGMTGLYLLEYGEVSNCYNFTARNVISYLILIPAGTTAVYHVISKDYDMEL